MPCHRVHGALFRIQDGAVTSEAGRQLTPCTPGCDRGRRAQVAPNVPPYDSYSARTCCNGPLEAMEWILKQQTAPSETAAVIVEPILGEGGFLTPPPAFLPGLRKLCDKHGLLLILDEARARACAQQPPAASGGSCGPMLQLRGLMRTAVPALRRVLAVTSALCLHAHAVPQARCGACASAISASQRNYAWCARGLPGCFVRRGLQTCHASGLGDSFTLQIPGARASPLPVRAQLSVRELCHQHGLPPFQDSVPPKTNLTGLMPVLTETHLATHSFGSSPLALQFAGRGSVFFPGETGRNSDKHRPASHMSRSAHDAPPSAAPARGRRCSRAWAARASGGATSTCSPTTRSRTS